VDRTDEALAASVVADRLACRLDPAGERRLSHESIAPDGIEQLLLGHDPSPFPEQHGEEVEHLRLNRTELPSPAQLEPVEIKLTVLEEKDQDKPPRRPRSVHQSLTLGRPYLTQSPGVLHLSSKAEAHRARTLMHESRSGHAARAQRTEENP